MRKETYSKPTIEVVELTLEQGIAQTSVAGNPGVNDWGNGTGEDFYGEGN